MMLGRKNEVSRSGKDVWGRKKGCGGKIREVWGRRRVDVGE